MPDNRDPDRPGPVTTTASDPAPTSDDLTDTVTGLVALADLLHSPKLARAYVYICYYGPVEPADVIESLDLPSSTAYEYIERLEAKGLIETTGSRPKRLTAEPVFFIGQNDVAITPTLLHAVARQVVDDDIAYFVDRYGIERLAAALLEAGRHYAGQLTQRMVAEVLDVRSVEAMAVVQALEPVLATGKEYDPYFSQLFPDIADEMEFEREFDVSAPAPAVEPSESEDA